MRLDKDNIIIDNDSFPFRVYSMFYIVNQGLRPAFLHSVYDDEEEMYDRLEKIFPNLIKSPGYSCFVHSLKSYDYDYLTCNNFAIILEYNYNLEEALYNSDTENYGVHIRVKLKNGCITAIYSCAAPKNFEREKYEKVYQKYRDCLMNSELSQFIDEIYLDIKSRNKTSY